LTGVFVLKVKPAEYLNILDNIHMLKHSN